MSHRALGPQFQTHGDAVPHGYDGYVTAHHPETGEQMGYLNYQTISRNSPYHVPGFKIGMVEVDPRYRGQGVADQMLVQARRDIPEGKVDPGFLTEQGRAWWSRSGRSIAKNWKPR